MHTYVLTYIHIHMTTQCYAYQDNCSTVLTNKEHAQTGHTGFVDWY